MRADALGGRNRLVHGGSSTGSPIGLAAAAAVIHGIETEPGLYDEVDSRPARLANGIETAFADADVPGHKRRVGSMLQPFLAARLQEEPRDVNEATVLQPGDLYLRLCDELEWHGVYAHRYAVGRCSSRWPTTT